MDQVAEWLISMGLGQYAPRFAENHIEFSLLRALTDQDLKDLGVAAIGHRRKLMLAIAELGASAADRRIASVDSPQDAPVPANSDPHSFPAGFARSSVNVAERRHLTVMFCDLVGSTALASRLDPEDMREVVRAYQGACARVIGRYEGFVAQYLGDGVMAYFGYPQAHEDDAERAVRAGLELVAVVAKLDTKAKVEVRVGIATGLVVVGDLIGEHAAKERAVIGGTPNLAARLQGLAAPGSIVVSAATRHLLGGMFDLRDLGAQQVKGIDAPVQAFMVAGLRSFESRFEARAGGLTGFVGREEEGEHLLERKKLAWQGRGQVVLVSGEAGIGKSRLTAWLAERIGAEPHVRLRYQCTPHHRDSALYPFITQLERAAGFSPGDTADQKLDKLEELLALAKLESADAVPLFAALLAIPTAGRFSPLELSSAQQRQRTLAAMLEQTEALSRQKPILLVFEDAHWADATSLELLDMLVERIGRWPVLAIVTGRPEFSPAWAGRHAVSTLALSRLDRRDARAMVEGVTGGATLPAEVLDQIVQKTDGVPLFVEELTKTVLESGLLVEEGQSYRLAGPLQALAIPATLQDSLMARLDRSNPVKEIAQIGAAIGRQFSYKLLLAVASMDEATLRTGLAKLEEAELATRRGVPPDATWTFKHALVQDAAYESLLKSRRQIIHRRIAKVLREKFPDSAETEPEIIAHHFAQAGRIEQAVDWWTTAGNSALRRSANAEAINHFEQAIALADRSPGDPSRKLARVRLQIAYGQAVMAIRGFSAARTREVFARARELATDIEDASERYAIYYGLWVGSYIRSEWDQQNEIARIVLADLPARGQSAEACVGHRLVGTTIVNRGDYAAALPHFERAVEIYAAQSDATTMYRFGQDVGVVAHGFLGTTLWSIGQIQRAHAQLGRALEIGRSTGHAQSLAYALNINCQFRARALSRSDPVHVLTLADEFVQLARRHSLPFFKVSGEIAYGWALWHAGQREAGEATMANAEALRRELGIRYLLPWFGELIADVDAQSGRDEAAARRVEEILVQSNQMQLTWHNARYRRLHGHVLLRRSPADGEAALREAVSIARVQGARTYELLAALDLARLCRGTGREHEARDLLGPALVGFGETLELPEIGEAQRFLADLQ